MSGDLDGLPCNGHASLDAFTFAGRRLPGESDHLFVEVVGGAQVEGLGRLVVLEDGAGVGAGQLVGAGHDRLKHRVKLKRRAQGSTHVRQGLQLVH